MSALLAKLQLRSAQPAASPSSQDPSAIAIANDDPLGLLAHHSHAQQANLTSGPVAQPTYTTAVASRAASQVKKPAPFQNLGLHSGAASGNLGKLYCYYSSPVPVVYPSPYYPPSLISITGHTNGVGLPNGQQQSNTHINTLAAHTYTDMYSNTFPSTCVCVCMSVSLPSESISCLHVYPTIIVHVLRLEWMDGTGDQVELGGYSG
ncbi:hypothetical protein B0O80DRAFT_467363 [Mortierella sp. GBAus27b]|nr:hypothetical protein B0O80DRAFT_467363 [Mortierella sp. GBAus27b]